MASPPGAGGSRYVGRIVDPNVREDEQLEPEVELNPAPGLSAEASSGDEGGGTEMPSAGPAGAPEPSGAGAGRGAEVRERLLAKARASAQQAATDERGSLASELETIGRGRPPSTVDTETFAPPPASGRAPSSPLLSNPTPELSPNLVALFSVLVGIAAIASLTALFMSVETRFPETGAPPPPVVASPSPKAPPPAGPVARAKRQRQKQPGPWRLADAKGDTRYRFVEGTIGTDSFLKAFTAAGVAEQQGYRVLAAMRGVRDLDKCGKRDRFQALVTRGQGKLFAFEYLVGPEEVYQAKEGENGRLTGARLDLKVERGQIAGALSYDGSSFDKSAELAGFDPGLSKVVARALDGHMALDELERGDVLRVIAQELTVLGDFARYTGIEALELVRSDPKKGKLRIYYSDAPGVRGYYDHDGRAPFEGGWRKPVKDAPRTSPFNPKRLHPVLKKIMPHNGTDFGAPTGTPIMAASFGTVSFLGWGGPAGNLVKIMHPGGVETGYAHMSRFAEGIKVGDKVKRLQLIGYIGTTGRSTGPHLHFSASRDGKFFDAETLNLDGMRNLGKQEREAFLPVMTKYDPLLDAIPMPERYAPVESVSTPSTAPAASGSASPQIADEHEDVGDLAEEAAPGNAAAAAQAPNQAAHKPGGSSVYLSDKELLEAQSASDDGEVEE